MLELSIITINLNNYQGLKKTISSVIHQSFSDFEFIVIDGDSSDGSKELIEQYSDKISYGISEPDTGVYNAMNKGINRAQGKYLLFLNSGDYLVDKNVLENVFSYKHTSDIIAGRCNITREGRIVHTTNPPSNITFGYLYYTGLNHQSTFIRRELFMIHGLYKEEFTYNADIEFWYRTIVLCGASTASVPVEITYYNLEGISMRENHTAEFAAELEKIFNQPLFKKIIPDYDNWLTEKSKMKALYWIKTKKTLFFIVNCIYRVSGFMSKFFKRY